MSNNKKVPEDVTIKLPMPEAKAEALPVTVTAIKEEIDRIGVLLKDTEEGVRWTKNGIYIGIGVGIVLFIINILLQHFKVI